MSQEFVRLQGRVNTTNNNMYIITQFQQIDNHLEEEFKIECMSTDAEWGFGEYEQYRKSRYRNPEILTKPVIAYNYKHEEMVLIPWDENAPLPVEIYPDNWFLIRCDVSNTTILDIIDASNKIHLVQPETPLYFYYSDVDVQAVASKNVYKQLLKSEDISKKRNLSGSIRINEKPKQTIKLVDLYGAFNSNLDDACKSVGIELPCKDLVTREEKKNMKEVMYNDPDRFLKYAVGDVQCLTELLKARVDQVNVLVKDVLDIDLGYTVNDVPRSSGKLTDDVFRRFLAKNYRKLIIAAEMTADTTDWKSRELFRDKGRSDGDGEWVVGKRSFKIHELHKYWRDKEKNLTISGLQHGSIPALGSKSPRFGTPLGALVNGGRCVNENPVRYHLKDVLDADLKSCYGSSLANFKYPVGIPSVEYGRVDDTSPCKNLDEMWGKIHEFERGLYTVVVHTDERLSFKQDLVFSNPDITAKQIQEKIITRSFNSNGNETLEMELTHIDGGFCMVNREISNGILTAHSLELLKRVSTAQEWKELKSKIKVDLVVGYKTKDSVSEDEYCKTMFNAHTRGSVEPGNNYTELDKRSRQWVAIPLHGFVQPFIEKRGQYKKLYKQDKSNKYYDLMQKACKLFINTLYGVMASPYFPTSNAILANNITDSARTGVWMMSKALGTNMSITDGGAYQNSDIRFIQGRNPGLDTMSNYHKLDKHRSIRKGVLVKDFGLFHQLSKSLAKGEHDESLIKATFEMLVESGIEDTLLEFQQVVSVQGYEGLHEKYIDVLALKHTNDFWSNYDMKLSFEIAHKPEHTASGMIHWNKSDYLFVNPVVGDKQQSDKVIANTEYLVKVRGAKEVDHMKKQFLAYLGAFNDGCDTWMICSEFQKPNDLKEKLLHDPAYPIDPGAQIEKVYTLKPNFNHIQYDTLNQRKYHLQQIQKIHRELQKHNDEVIVAWAESGDEDWFGELKVHPVFTDKPKQMTLGDYLYGHYLPSGHDVALQNKTGKSRKSKVTPETIVKEHFYNLDCGMGVNESLRQLSEKFGKGTTAIKGYVSQYNAKLETADPSLMKSEQKRQASKRSMKPMEVVKIVS